MITSSVIILHKLYNSSGNFALRHVENSDLSNINYQIQIEIKFDEHESNKNKISRLISSREISKC